MVSGLTVKEISRSLRISERRTVKIIRDNNLSYKNRRYDNKRKTDFGEAGNKYNHLTIIDFSYNEKYRSWYAIVECDCGNISQEVLRKLKNGQRQTCGKYGCEFFHALRVLNGRKAGWTGFGEIYGNRWASWRIGAENRGLPFEITIEYGWNLFLSQRQKMCIKWSRNCFW